MITNYYSVRDEKVGAFMPPFPMRSDGEAIRGFIDACADKNTAFSKHPADFVLFNVGKYDDVTGRFIPSEPVEVMTATQATAVQG